MEILGIGNALMDIFCFSDDETALSLGLHPNQAAHMTPERLDEILLAIPHPILVSGGTAPNALKVSSALGVLSAFIGCTGTEDRDPDLWAQIFRADLTDSGVQCRLENRVSATGRCLVIHMPGAMKSIACAPGAAPAIHPDQIDSGAIASARMVFVDGQVLRNREVIEKIVSLCGERGVPLALDIASADIAQAKSAEIVDIIESTDSILFMNEAEATALALALEPTIPGDRGIIPLDKCLDTVFSFYAANTRHVTCIVMKMGKNGAKLWSGGTVYESPAIIVENPLDDTGAGDAFAGAFMTALLRKMPLGRALAFANSAARECLSVPGTRLDREAFAGLRAELELIEAES